MKAKFIFMWIASAMLFTACSSDDNEGYTVGPGNNGEQASVQFELDASMLNYAPSGPSLRYSPEYTSSGFSIYAFRQAIDGDLEGQYVFEKTINLANMTYRESDRKLVGSDLLNIGTYKFISAYGLNQPTSILSVPTFNILNDSYFITYNGGTTPLGEIFLQDTDAANLTSYDLGINSTNPTVTATLNRAVSRVDIMFFKGTRNEDGTYTELPYNTGNNVFGNKTIQQIQLRYGNLNNVMNVFGNYATTTPMSANIELSNFSEIITIGNNTVSGTIVGDEDYTRYDAVASEDIIYGGAHIFGNYLFPNRELQENESTIKNTSLEIYIKPEYGLGRTINVSVDEEHLLPVEKNKVTLVKIYIIERNPGPGPGPGPGPDPDPEEPTVFTTNVDFEIEIETVWEGSHEVTGEVN
ncbi:MAG TPA: hypothetical protein DIT04_07640 [Dysgonomonas sp.]|nr:hypothetical protein [Dysgonomonas sp.]